MFSPTDSEGRSNNSVFVHNEYNFWKKYLKPAIVVCNPCALPSHDTTIFQFWLCSTVRQSDFCIQCVKTPRISKIPNPEKFWDSQPIFGIRSRKSWKKIMTVPHPFNQIKTKSWTTLLWKNKKKNPLKYRGCENDRAPTDPFDSGGGHYIIWSSCRLQGIGTTNWSAEQS